MEKMVGTLDGHKIEIAKKPSRKGDFPESRYVMKVDGKPLMETMFGPRNYVQLYLELAHNAQAKGYVVDAMHPQGRNVLHLRMG